MGAAPHSLRLLLLSLAAWISRHQQDVIEYLVEENRVLKELLGGERSRLIDDAAALRDRTLPR